MMMNNIMNNELDEDFSELGDTPNTLSSPRDCSAPMNHRGWTRLIELDKYVNAHGKIPIHVYPNIMKHVGPGATKLSNAVGVYVRDCFPVRAPLMKDVPRETLTLLKNRLQKHFTIDLTSPYVHAFLDDKMATVFREFRAELCKHYKKFDTSEEARANPPTRLKNAIEDWRFLCNKFEDPNWQRTSEQNQKNRAALPFNHKAGSKSFLQILEEEKEKTVNGVFGPIELFERTHTSRIDGKWVSPVAEHAHKRMKELQVAPTPEGSQPLLPAEITESVLGSRSGYIKGMSYGPKPPPKSRGVNGSSSASLTQMQNEHSQEINVLKEELQRTKAEIDDKYQKQQEAMEAMQKIIEELSQRR